MFLFLFRTGRRADRQKLLKCSESVNFSYLSICCTSCVSHYYTQKTVDSSHWEKSRSLISISSEIQKCLKFFFIFANGEICKKSAIRYCQSYWTTSSALSDCKLTNLITVNVSLFLKMYHHNLKKIKPWIVIIKKSLFFQGGWWVGQDP